MTAARRTACAPRPTPHAPCHGFTLIEVLVTVMIAGTLGAALIVSLLIGRNTYLSSSASIDVQQEARRAFQVMVSELREGGRVESPITNWNDPIPDFTNVTRVNFQIARSYDVVTCGGICWGSDETVGGNGPDDWIHYFQLNRQLIKCNSDAADTAIASSANCRNWRVLANDVRALPSGIGFLVAYDSTADTVTLTLEIERLSAQLPGGRMTSGQLRTTVKLRNP